MEKAATNPKRKWKMLICVFLVLILVFGVGIFIVSKIGTREKLIYVATTGDDVTGKGTSGSPYRTIKKAAEMATPGTIVLVRPGTYVEEDIRPNVSGTKDAMIVFRPETDSDIGSVIIKHNDTFTGSTITPMEKSCGSWIWDGRKTRYSITPTRISNTQLPEIRIN